MIIAATSVLTRTLAARGGAWGALQTGVTQLGIIGVNVGTGVLTARLLGPSGRGEFAAVMMWFLIPSLVATAGLQSGLIVLAQRDQACRLSLFLAGLIIGAIVFVPTTLVCLLLVPHFMHGYDASAISLSRLALLASALHVGMTAVRQSLLGSRKMHLFNLSTVGIPAAYLACLLVAVVIAPLTVPTAFLAQVGATVLVLVPTVLAFTRMYAKQVARPLALVAPLARYSWKAAPVDLATVFYWNIDRLVLVAVISPAQLGIYAVATSFARLIGTVQASVSSVALVDMSNRSPEAREIYVHRALRVLLWCLVFACTLGWIASPIILPLVYGPDFAQAVGVSRVLLVESAISCFAQLLIEAFLASHRATYAAVVQSTFSAVLFALLLLSTRWGGFGAAVAMLLAAVFKLAFLLAGLRRIDVGWPRLLPRRADLPLFRRMHTSASGCAEQ